MTQAPTMESLALARSGAIAHLELDRADKANALGPAFWRELPQALDALDRDPAVRVVLLSGRGRHFCAGIDLASMQPLLPASDREPARERERLWRLIREMQDAVGAIERCRKPVIAVIHGRCMGAGFDLACACDLRFAARDAGFAISEIDVGMVADLGTLQRAPHLLPGGLLRELALTGRIMDAEEAARHAFVHGVADDREAAIAMATAMAERIAAKSPLAVAGTKQMLLHARDHGVADGLVHVALHNAAMLPGKDVLTGARAALSKQEAAFDDLPS